MHCVHPAPGILTNVFGLQPEVGEKYAVLIHPIAKLADNMTRDIDPRVRRTFTASELFQQSKHLKEPH